MSNQKNDKEKDAVASAVDAIVMHMELNLNSTIKVKLLEKGYQRMADLHNQYIGQIRNWEWRDKEYYENKADENGYTEFQFWHFMECFGEVTSIGMADYYETTVLIRKKDLTECA